MKKFSITVTALLVCLLLLLTGCTSFYNNSAVRGFSGSNHGTVMKARFSSISGDRGAYIPLKQGDKISITYDLSIQEGHLFLTFYDSYGNVLFRASDTPLIDYDAAAGTKEITADADQTYILRLDGASAKGSYDISWSVTKAGG